MKKVKLSELTVGDPKAENNRYIIRNKNNEEVFSCRYLYELSQKLLIIIVETMFPDGNTWEKFFKEIEKIEEDESSNEGLQYLQSVFNIRTYNTVKQVGDHPQDENYRNIYKTQDENGVFAIVRRYGGFVKLLNPLPEGVSQDKLNRDNLTEEEIGIIRTANEYALYFNYALAKEFASKFGVSLFEKLGDAFQDKPDGFDYLSELVVTVDEANAKSISNNNAGGENMAIKEKLDALSKGKDRQIIFNGAPGTGKTFSIREWMKEHCVQFEKETDDKSKGVWEFVQFHPSYDYTDFVEGLRPVKLNPSEKDSTFVRLDGVFKRFCRAAVEDYRLAEKSEKPEEARKYYFVIDEINRADLGKVFGELMFGLEEDYRGEENAFPTQYMNLPTYYRDGDDCYKPYAEGEDCFEKGFFIPKNVYIIGTMNDIDRSVDSLDFALRRRFKWHEVTADGVMKAVLEDMFSNEIYGKDSNKTLSKDEANPINQLIKKLTKTMESVNHLIENADKKLGLSTDYCIGPAYLKDFIDYAKELADSGKPFNTEDDKYKECADTVWDNKIHQILINYCRGRDETTTQDFIKACGRAFGVEQKENEIQNSNEE